MKKLLLLTITCIAFANIKAQNKLTPETLWKLGRVSEPRISPDGKNLVYNVRTFDVPANKGQSEIYVLPIDGNAEAKNLLNHLVDKTTASNDKSNARWRPDGKKIGFTTADANGDNQSID